MADEKAKPASTTGAGDTTKEAKAAEILAAKIKRINRGALMAQYSLGASRHCLQSDWSALARAVGVSSGDLDALKGLVKQLGLPEPARKRVGK